jgi:hypothetical protein
VLELDTLWKSITQREQLKLMEVLVEQVEYDQQDVAISVSFHRSGIKTLAAKADEVLV